MGKVDHNVMLCERLCRRIRKYGGRPFYVDPDEAALVISGLRLVVDHLQCSDATPGNFATPGGQET